MGMHVHAISSVSFRGEVRSHFGSGHRSSGLTCAALDRKTTLKALIMAMEKPAGAGPQDSGTTSLQDVTVETSDTEMKDAQQDSKTSSTAVSKSGLKKDEYGVTCEILDKDYIKYKKLLSVT